MTCREFADFMMDYLSGELSSESRAAFDYHLSLCTQLPAIPRQLSGDSQARKARLRRR